MLLNILTKVHLAVVDKKGVDMTPCEELGYKVGDKFEVVPFRNESLFDSSVRIGDTVLLKEDDDTKMPLFTGEDDLVIKCVHISHLKKINIPTKRDGGKSLMSEGAHFDENSLLIVNLISSVAPNISVGDALKIAKLLLQNGFKQ